MLDLLNSYLKFGIASNGDQSGWPLGIAMVLITVMIVKRRARN